jgi:hypothetical protein
MGLNLKKYMTPFLEFRVGHLSMQKKALQSKLMEIKTYLEILNEEVDQSRFYLNLTFNDLPGENRQRVIVNLTQSYLNYSKQARIVVDLIGELDWQAHSTGSLFLDC